MPSGFVVRQTGAVQARPGGAGGVVVELGGADVVELAVVEVVEVVAVEEVVEVVAVVEVVELVEVVDVDGEVVVEDVVGAGSSQVTAITVGLTAVCDSLPLPQSTLMLPPTGRAIA